MTYNLELLARNEFTPPNFIRLCWILNDLDDLVPQIKGFINKYLQI
jgi:hypothetical protein